MEKRGQNHKRKVIDRLIRLHSSFFYPFTIHNLEFDTIPINDYSSSGTKYTRLVRVGMPKIPENSLNLAFYLYRSVKNAEQGIGIGGTGFYVSVPSEKHPRHLYTYGVTNWHVALEGGASVIRANMEDGTTDIFDYEPTEWDFIPNGGDIAISPILELEDKHIGTLLPIDGFATSEIITKRKINVGDNVFMIGRFIDHDGKTTNLPAVRFGNISIMPTFIPDEANNRDGKSYCIDMHSRTGYSGSPVIVYRSVGDDLTNLSRYNLEAFMYLLGIHWGQFPENWKDQKGKKIQGFSGMTCVTPAERILNLINSPKLKAERDRRDAEREKNYQKYGYPPIPD